MAQVQRQGPGVFDGLQPVPVLLGTELPEPASSGHGADLPMSLATRPSASAAARAGRRRSGG